MDPEKGKLFFLETFVSEKDMVGRHLVSLAPEVSCSLDDKGVRYSIPEDYYSEKEIFAGEDDYFYEQLEWFRRFDRLFKDKVAFCAKENLSLATAHYYRVKCLIDGLVLSSRIFSLVLERAGADDVLYAALEPPEGTTQSVYLPFNEQKAVLRPLAEKICEKRGIKFAKLDIPAQRAETNASVLARQRAKDVLKMLHAKSLYRLFKYAKWNSVFAKKDGIVPAIMSLHAGSIPLDELIKSLIKAGGKVLLKEGTSMYAVDGIFEKKILDLAYLKQRSEAIKVEKELESVYEAFMGDKYLMGWVNDKCGIDVSGVLKPYIHDLVQNISLSNIIEIPLLQDLYNKEGIDFVVARAASEKETVASLLAGARGHKRVCLQHSSGAYDSKRNDVIEFLPFDHYFTIHSEAEEQARAIMKNDYLGSCNIYQAPYQMKAIHKRWASAKRDNNLVIYIPTKLFLGYRTFNSYLYNVTWYYKLQKALIDLFSEKKDTKFIFKYAQGQEWSARSILPYIRKKGSGNIFVVDKPLYECLGKAGRVIIDYPSTSLYEAAAAGAPVMSLYRDILPIRPEAAKLFGKSLRKFNDISDAVKAIDEFLSEDPEAYKVDIPMSDNDTVEILKMIKNSSSQKNAIKIQELIWK